MTHHPHHARAVESLPMPRRSSALSKLPLKARLVVAVVIVAISVVGYLSTSEENPLTGENQRVGLTTAQEVALGIKAAPPLIRQFGGADNDRYAQLKIKTIGSILVDAMLRHETATNPYEFEFTLLADKKIVNAFALPGGRIFITRALFDQLDTDAKLAGVLGHEVGHVVHRHGAEHLAQQKLTQGIVGAAAVAADRADAATAAAVIANLINMKYGREDELECDEYGLIIMAEAGYDPTAMIDVMNVLAKAGGGSGSRPEWTSTHPDPGNRIERIKESIKRLELDANKKPALPKSPGKPPVKPPVRPPIPPPTKTNPPEPSPIDKAFQQKRSDVWMTENGTVERILRDDNEGSRHQRFIVKIPSGRTVLIAHNIDLAPRVPVKVGDKIRFRGEYEYNVQGGIIHWTHHDPTPNPATPQREGWIEHNGETYR